MKSNSSFVKTNKTKKSIMTSNVSKIEYDHFNIIVTIGNWSTNIYCGNASQSVNWLFNYSLFLYENDYCFKSGLIFAYIDSSGIMHDAKENSNKIINKCFNNNDKLSLLKKEEYEILILEYKKSKSSFGKTISRSKSPDNLLSSSTASKIRS